MSVATKQGPRLGGRRIKWDFWSTVTLVGILFAIMFICYPFLYLFQNALTDQDGHLTLAHFLKFFKKNYYIVCLTNTLKLAFWATILATLVGLPLAYISTRYNTLLRVALADDRGTDERFAVAINHTTLQLVGTLGRNREGQQRERHH